jgi:predicted NUDIX family NTP pyrophosphohydrolase
MYRVIENELEVLLVHPGGPFFKNKDAGAWSVPKGEFEPDEDPLKAAIREFTEELGTVPEGDFVPLTPIIQKGGKTVVAWTFQGTLDAVAIKSNTFFMEWPPRSGKRQEFPEIDKAEWFSLSVAKQKILESQMPLLVELEQQLNSQI